MIDNKAWKISNVAMSSGSHFTPPKERFIKLNFDGASKGNPGEASLGGLFRDS